MEQSQSNEIHQLWIRTQTTEQSNQNENVISEVSHNRQQCHLRIVPYWKQRFNRYADSEISSGIMLSHRLVETLDENYGNSLRIEYHTSDMPVLRNTIHSRPDGWIETLNDWGLNDWGMVENFWMKSLERPMSEQWESFNTPFSIYWER